MKKLLISITLLSLFSLYSCNSTQPTLNKNYFTNNVIDNNQIIEYRLSNILHTGNQDILGKQITIKYGSYPKDSDDLKFCTNSIEISTKKINYNIYKFNDVSKSFYCELKKIEPRGPIGYSSRSKNDILDRNDSIKILKILKTNNSKEKEIINKAIDILTKEEIEIDDNLTI